MSEQPARNTQSKAKTKDLNDLSIVPIFQAMFLSVTDQVSFKHDA
ncbi:MAG: hypothetical protein AAB308_18230 [Nitrospirota bacterium]|jgi:hypothetical protein